MGGSTTGIVREWDDERGFGIIDSDDTPGGCWAHFSHVIVDGYASLAPGRRVTLQWESARQDGYAFRAISVTPDDRPTADES